jgi:hypothetical protein
MPEYDVIVVRTHIATNHQMATITADAETEEEAKSKAQEIGKKIGDEDDTPWTVSDCEEEVESVEAVEVKRVED